MQIATFKVLDGIGRDVHPYYAADVDRLYVRHPDGFMVDVGTPTDEQRKELETDHA